MPASLQKYTEAYPQGYPSVKGGRFAIDFFGGRNGQVDFHDWTTIQSGFQIVNHKLKNTGAAQAVILSKLIQGKDFRIQLRATKGSNYMSVLFRASADGTNYYMARINGAVSPRVLEVYRSTAGTLASIATQTLGPTGRENNILDITCIGSKIICSTAGGTLTCSDTSFTSGFLGIRSAVGGGVDQLEWLEGEII